jgi:hypothetical protein
MKKAYVAVGIDMKSETQMPSKKGSSILSKGYLVQKAWFLNGIVYRFKPFIGSWY